MTLRSLLVELVEFGDVAELADDIEGVAAHRAIGAEADAQALVEHLQRGGDALGGFDVGDHVVGDADVAGLQERDVGVGDENAVGGDEAAVEEAEGIEVFDGRLVVVAAQGGDLLGHLGDVHQHGGSSSAERRDLAEVGSVDGVRGVRREGRGDERVVADSRRQICGRVGDAAVGRGGIGRGES
jgi:hypothetical protein